MELLFHIITCGVLIGILISAPMGPIGMLCIQRTLSKGRWAGMFTGVGAAVSDLIYCMLTGFGLSFITDIIDAHQLVIQLVGGAVICAFGVYLFRKNPTRALQRDIVVQQNYWTDAISGFLFTFSNPLILFFIIGLYARFNFIMPEYQWGHYILAYCMIMAGALAWWYTVSLLVNKLRARVNVRSLWLVNRVIGSILFIMGVIGIAMSLYDLS